MGGGRVLNTVKHRGLKAGLSEIAPAAKYYFSQTSEMFYKPLKKEFHNNVKYAIATELGLAFTKSAYRYLSGV